MATYKVPQDVEAEDKLLGPLTLKQFIFALAFVALLYIAYLLFMASPLLVILPLPLLVITGAFAFWQRKDQPVEVFFRASINFYTKSRIRKWDQDGVLELVEITAPKREVVHYTDGRSDQEVESQLNILTRTLNSRGWNSKLNDAYTQDGEDRVVPLFETPAVHTGGELDKYANNEQVENKQQLLTNTIDQQINQQSAIVKNEAKQLVGEPGIVLESEKKVEQNDAITGV